MLFNGGSLIKVDGTRCLNYLHHAVGCNHCVVHCPGGALAAREDGILLEEDKCLGCGLCFADCPTEVFSADLWNETTIIEEARRQGAPVTQFFCGYNDAPFRSGEDREKGAVQVPTCLSSISKGAWYELGLMTGVELRLEKCRECPMQATLPRLKLAVETAMEWVAACGRDCEFAYIHNLQAVQKRKKLRAAPAGLKVTSRRDLFLSLFKQGREMARQVWEQEVACHGAHRNRAGAANCLPRWQKRLAGTFTSHFREGGSPAYWPSIVKGENCTNCGLCSENCPTQALQVSVENGKAKHSFIAGQCIDCRICMLFCPTQSITRDREPRVRPFEPEIILEKTVVPCPRCGEYTYPGEGSLCYWCRNEPTDSELLSDVWKHLLGSSGLKTHPAF